MKKRKTFEMKRFLLCLVLVIAVTLFAVAGTVPTVPRAAHADSEIAVIAEVTGLVAGQADPEFTVMIKVENNTATLGGLEIILTPLDENVVVGNADTSYVAGDTWSTANGFARVDDDVNIHLIGTDDTGITKSSFIHGGFKFKYNGTPDGGIAFNVALEAAADDCGDEVPVTYDGQPLTGDTDTPNFTATGRVLETTNTLTALTLKAGDTQLVSGTDDEQTATTEVANADKGKVKISVTRAGAKSKIKVTEGDKTLVAEQTGDLADASLGDLAVGEHTVTVTVTSESGSAKTYTIKFTVAEAGATPMNKPTAAATTSGGYSGSPIDFTPSGMAELASSGKVKLYAVSESGTETEVDINAFKPTNAGTYKIVAKPANGYCWSGNDTSDPEYTFSVKKAKITAANGTNGGLPTLTSDSYKGSTDVVVEMKYYSDPACTQEVSKDALVEGTKYYVKPFLKAGMDQNFEFDDGTTTQAIVNSGAEYVKPTTTPNPTPAPAEEKKGIPWWVWLIVAAVLLIAILLVVLLLAKRRKNDDDDDRKRATPYPQPVFVPQGTHRDEAKTARLEDRIHELEKEANEREVTRYKEEAERAEKKAEKAEHEHKEPPVILPPVAPAPATTVDTAAQERVKELEARMREIEKEAHEKELQRYKEEAERANRNAGKRVIRFAPPTPVAPAAPVAPVAPVASVADTAAQERIRELEARMREMEKDAHEVERSARDRELSKYKEEAEQARRDAERARMDSYYGPRPGGYAGSVGGDAERVKELEARMREMEKEAHEKELQRYKEEAEAAKRAAEQRYYSKNPMPEPAYVPYRTNEEQASPYVQKLEEQLRRMEQEAHERELARYRSEAERARKEAEELARRSRRQEEELSRLRDLQAVEQRSLEIVSARNGATAGRGADNEMLQRMEEQMRRQNSELQFLTEELERKLAAAIGRK